MFRVAHAFEVETDFNGHTSQLVSHEMLLLFRCFPVLRCMSAWKKKKEKKGDVEKQINLTSGEISFTASLSVIVSAFMWDKVERSGGGGGNYALKCSRVPLQTYIRVRLLPSMSVFVCLPARLFRD